MITNEKTIEDMNKKSVKLCPFMKGFGYKCMRDLCMLWYSKYNECSITSIAGEISNLYDPNLRRSDE